LKKKLYLDGKDIYIGIKKGTEVLIKNKDEINALNVFPVPDGDTGSNMSAAMLEACQWLDKVKDPTVTKDILKALKDGLLMGARGNSGVILSQIFRGFTEAIETKKKVNTNDFILALKRAKEVSYNAVIRPVEGTLLTLIRRLSERSEKELSEIEDFVEFMDKLYIMSDEIVRETPKYLKKLRDANVVDAGAKGFSYVLKGFSDSLKGDTQVNLLKIETASAQEIASFAYEDIKYQYCTEVILNLKDAKIPKTDLEKLRAFLEENGDSIVLVHQNEFLKCHVHSNHPGIVFEKFLEFGELMKVKVENMKVQHEHLIDDKNKTEEMEVQQQEEETETETETEVFPQRNWGIVSVSPGKGLSEIFKSLGVNKIIFGGQTMNPSVKDIADALNAMPYSKVIVLPNNPNIIMTAQKAAEMSDKEVLVLPTKYVQEGVAALLGFQDEMERQDLEQSMQGYIDSIVPIQVTYAVRDSEIGSEKIKKNENLVFVGKDLKAHGKDIYKETLKALTEVIDQGYEIVTIFYGEGVEEKHINQFVKRLTDKYSKIEVEVHYGGQQHYPMLISVE